MPCRICNFPKPDGHPCGSAALAGKKLCYFHQRALPRQQRIEAAVRRADVLGPKLPPMRSSRDIVAAISEVLQAMADGRLHHRRAGRILFNLQQASSSLRKQDSARN